jgi:DNA-binding LytR/AlgR family response regulator
VGISFFPRLKHSLSPSDWCVEALVLLVPIVGGYACLLQLLSRRAQVVSARIEAAAESASPKAPPAPRLAKRLPSALARDIQALTVEDHYVRIHTATGSHLVLMRLSDAIAEMDGVEGLRVHRSWWVARKAVRSVHLNGRGGRLILHDGLQAPVARSALSVVRAAGWTRGGLSVSD